MVLVVQMQFERDTKEVGDEDEVLGGMLGLTTANKPGQMGDCSKQSYSVRSPGPIRASRGLEGRG